MNRIASQPTSLIAAAALAAALAGAPGMAGAAEPGVTDTEIRIGSFGPLTGPNFVFGKNPMNGVEAYFATVNEAGGVNGRKLVLVREDDQCDPANTITVVRKLIHTENVFALVGGSCSNGVMAARPDIVQAQIPFVNFAAAGESISNPPADNIYTTMLTSALESHLQVKYLQKIGAKRVAVVSQRDAWGMDRYKPLMAALEAAGIKPVANEELSVQANDATAQVLRVRASNADAVVMLLYPKPAALFLRDAKRIGYQAEFLGQSSIPDPVAFADQVGVAGATDRFLTISPLRYGASAPEVADWRKRFETMFPQDKIHSYNLYGVASATVVVQALRQAGNPPTREGFLKALGGLKDFEVSVYPGKINCADSHQCHKTAAWIRKKGDDSEVVAITALD